jgi:hypothetical protein
LQKPWFLGKKREEKLLSKNQKLKRKAIRKGGFFNSNLKGSFCFACGLLL